MQKIDLLFMYLMTSLVVFFSSCTSVEKAVVPLSADLRLDETYTIIWNGISMAYRYDQGQWVRDAAYDYQFNVVQKRYEDHWKSVKSVHRLHPDYDGKAGARAQTMYFELHFRLLEDGLVQADLISSLGNGKATTDAEFRRSEIVMQVADAGRFWPYNRIRISQVYDYEAGKLTETVELFKEQDGKEIPFMKNEEVANIYLPGKLAGAPTVLRP